MYSGRAMGSEVGRERRSERSYRSDADRIETPRRAPGVCVLCGTSGAPVVWREGEYRARQCGCGVLYVDPQPGCGDADVTRDLHCDGYYRLGARVRFEFLRRFVARGKLLEIGFGRGHVLELARNAGFLAYGIEPNLAAIASARSRGFEAEHATIETSKLPERAFDAVFHVDLINHLPDPIAALDAMRRRLRPGGVMVCEVGAMGGVHPRWHRWLGTLCLPAHRNMFSEQALVALLARADLEPIAVQRFSLFGALLLGRVCSVLEERGNALRRPVDATGLPPLTDGAFALGERLMTFARYRFARVLPATTALGQLTLFVAARERGHRTVQSAPRVAHAGA